MNSRDSRESTFGVALYDSLQQAHNPLERGAAHSARAAMELENNNNELDPLASTSILPPLPLMPEIPELSPLPLEVQGIQAVEIEMGVETDPELVDPSSTVLGKRKLHPQVPLATSSNLPDTPVDSPLPGAPADGSLEPDAVEEEYATLSRAPTLVPHHPARGTEDDSALQYYSTTSHPLNKTGFRYVPCGPSPTAPPLLPLHRTIPSDPTTVRFSWEDRSPFILISEDAKSVMSEKGWRAARANVGLREGAWYWEIEVTKGGGDGAAVRVGVGRREGSVNAPVGIDGHSYAYRDMTGDCVTRARPKPYGAPFATSSVIGIYLCLPPRPPPNPSPNPALHDPSIITRKRVPIRYKGQLYFESLEYQPSPEMIHLSLDPANLPKPPPSSALERTAPGTKPRSNPVAPVEQMRPLPVLPGSKLVFFLDGVCQGTAFKDLYDFIPLALPPGHPHLREKRRREVDKRGMLNVQQNFGDDGACGYYPMVSVFGGGGVSINSGPEFAFPPPVDIEGALRALGKVREGQEDVGIVSKGWRPLSERHDEFYEEQAALDLLDEQTAIHDFESGVSLLPDTSSNARATGGGGTGRVRVRDRAAEKRRRRREDSDEDTEEEEAVMTASSGDERDHQSEDD